MKQWYLYILECADSSFYTGITVDLKQRLEKHNQGIGARFTRGRRPVKIVYHEKQPDRASASRRELEVKKLTREKKMLLIKNKFTKTI